MIYGDKTEKLIRGLFDVQNEVGLGRDEERYHQAYKIWLQEKGIPFESKSHHPLAYQGVTIHTLYPDFILWDSITLELKAVTRRLSDRDRVQIYNYLKRRGDQLGLLVNMGLERIICDQPKTTFVECWDCWAHGVPSDVQTIGDKIRRGLSGVYAEHGTGYGREIVEFFVAALLKHAEVRVTKSPSAHVSFHGISLGSSPLDCIVIDRKVLFVWSALFDDNGYNIHRGRSFMSALGLDWGIAVNFGKRKLEINSLIAATSTIHE